MKKKLLYISLVILVLFFQPAFQQPPIEIQIPFLKFIIQFSFYLALATLSIVSVLLISKKSLQPIIAIIAVPFFFFALFGIVVSFFLYDDFYKDTETYVHTETNEKYIYQYLDEGALGGNERLIHARKIFGDKLRWFSIEDSLNLKKGKWYIFENDKSKDSIVIP